MTAAPCGFDRLAEEHQTLMAAHGRAQARCSELLAQQAREVAALQSEVVRLRGAVIVRDTALAIARDAAQEDDAASDNEVVLDAVLAAADLVICQTGCLGHDAYWRVQEHCRRTGKPCVLVDSPQAMLWLRDGELR